MLRLDGRLALVRGLLRPSSELSGAGSRGADQLVVEVERDAAEPGQRGGGWDRERRSRSRSRPATARQDDEARRPLSGGLAAKRGASVRLFLLELHRDVYELCCPTKPLHIGSFHDQFRYSPEREFLGSVLLSECSKVI